MSLVEDLIAGCLASGVSKPTLLLLNAALLGCILLLLGLLFATGTAAPDLLPHFAVLLFFAVGLIISINWLVGQLGTVSASSQRQEVFGPGDSGGATAAEGSSGAKAGAADAPLSGAAGGEVRDEIEGQATGSLPDNSQGAKKEQ